MDKECFVTQLKAASNNPNLPVLLIPFDYVKTTADSQYVSLNDYVENMPLNRLKTEVKFKLKSTGGETIARCFYVRGGGYNIYIQNGQLTASAYLAGSAISLKKTVTASLDAEYTVVTKGCIDVSSPAEVSINGSSETAAEVMSGSIIQTGSLFGGPAGEFEIHSVKMWDISSDTLIANMEPVEDASGVPCLYDYVTKQYLYANTGNLAVGNY